MTYKTKKKNYSRIPFNSAVSTKSGFYRGNIGYVVDKKGSKLKVKFESDVSGTKKYAWIDENNLNLELYPSN